MIAPRRMAQILADLSLWFDEHDLRASSVDVQSDGDVKVHVRTIAELGAWARVFGAEVTAETTATASVHTKVQGTLGALRIEAVHVELTSTYRAAYREAGDAVEKAAQRILAEAQRCSATYCGAPCPGEDIQADGRCPQHTTTSTAREGC